MTGTEPAGPERRPVGLRLHGDLADLADLADRAEVHIPLNDRQTVRDLVEGLGVPHTETGRILVDGEVAGLDHQVDGGEEVEVEPPALPVPMPGGRARFVLDVHLGQLARHLRLLGIDVDYHNNADDDELVTVAVDQDRVLLSRDRGLLKRRAVTHGHLVRSDDPDVQLLATIRRYGLCDHLRPFTRCLACNGLPVEVAKSEVVADLEPRTRQHYDDFRRCPDCGRIYWDGSHTDRLLAVVDRVRGTCAEVG
jgi:uncharacterized protein